MTETPLGALKVVKYLRDKMIVMPPNIKPSRSRNTLIDIEALRSRLQDLLLRADRGEISEVEFTAQLEEVAKAPQVGPENPHSSEYYRAIQFTVRQLIKLRNPLYADLKELKNQARSNPVHADLLKLIEKIDLTHIQREIRFFYPYEIQVFDRSGAEENERGRSAHSDYKRAQVLSAMKRVMGGLADASR